MELGIVHGYTNRRQETLGGAEETIDGARNCTWIH